MMFSPAATSAMLIAVNAAVDFDPRASLLVDHAVRRNLSNDSGINFCPPNPG